MTGLSYELTSRSLDTFHSPVSEKTFCEDMKPTVGLVHSGKVGYPRISVGYLLLTFMLPKAEGCGTGLQLSAKDVVLGRPDMIQSR